MILVDIHIAVFNRFNQASDLLPIKWPEKDFSHNDQSYIELFIVPATTDSFTVDGSDVMSGIIQANVYVKDNQGVILPSSEAQKILDLFPRDLVLDGVRIKKTGTISSPVNNGNSWAFTPVSIPYEVLS